MPLPGVSLTGVGGLNRQTGDGLTTVNSKNFDQLVLAAKGPVAVEFMSYGCPHCRIAEPFVQQVAGSLQGQVKMFRVNVPVEGALAERFGVEGTPTFVMFQNGQEVGRAEGPLPAFKTILEAVKGPFQG